jgi:Penicillin amidase
MSRLSLVLVVLALLLTAAPAAVADGSGDTSRYILPPGNYGGLPLNDDSLDQLPLYDALTPLRGNVTSEHINNLFLPENFEPIGQTHEEQTGRPGLRLIYDEYGIPHVYGQTREDVAFGAGWTTARDRGLLIQFGRGAARVAVADVPGINAFSLVTGAQSFVPSPEAEALVTAQKDLLVQTYGDKGRQILADAQAYADGLNAYWKANNINQPPATVNDVIAVTAFIGSIFGAGGGGEAANSELLAKLKQKLGPVRGYQAWDDVMLAEDPEAPTTIKRHFNLRPADRGQGPRLGDHRPGLDRVRRSAQSDLGAGARAPAGVELPGRLARPVGHRQLARGDGPAAGLLLPRDRPADRPARPGHPGAGGRGARPGDVHPDRAHQGLRLEPDLGRARRA